jgi:hypothetical protein
MEHSVWMSEWTVAVPERGVESVDKMGCGGEDELSVFPSFDSWDLVRAFSDVFQCPRS